MKLVHRIGLLLMLSALWGSVLKPAAVGGWGIVMGMMFGFGAVFLMYPELYREKNS